MPKSLNPLNKLFRKKSFYQKPPDGYGESYKTFETNTTEVWVHPETTVANDEVVSIEMRQKSGPKPKKRMAPPPPHLKGNETFHESNII